MLNKIQEARKIVHWAVRLGLYKSSIKINCQDIWGNIMGWKLDDVKELLLIFK